MILHKKNNLLQIVVLTTLLVFLGGCDNKPKVEKASLTVTIEPQKYFLDQLVGYRYDVLCLIPQGANPESYDPSPSQIMMLNKSKAYFKIGFMGIENSLIDKISDDLNFDIVDCSKDVLIINDTSCGHDHHDLNDHHHHAHEGGDPHYWNSVESAKQILTNMFDYLVEIDSINKQFYRENYNKELAKINETDSIIQSVLAKSKSRTFVIYHPALSYFAREYDLEQLSIEQNGKQPSPVQLRNLIDEAKVNNVNAIFIQREFDVKNAEIIADQLNLEPISIDLLSYDWHDEMIKIAKVIAGDE